MFPVPFLLLPDAELAQAIHPVLSLSTLTPAIRDCRPGLRPSGAFFLEQFPADQARPRIPTSRANALMGHGPIATSLHKILQIGCLLGYLKTVMMRVSHIGLRYVQRRILLPSMIPLGLLLVLAAAHMGAYHARAENLVRPLRIRAEIRNQAVQLVFRIEEKTAGSCGMPMGADRALVLIGKRQQAIHP